MLSQDKTRTLYQSSDLLWVQGNNTLKASQQGTINLDHDRQKIWHMNLLVLNKIKSPTENVALIWKKKKLNK